MSGEVAHAHHKFPAAAKYRTIPNFSSLLPEFTVRRFKL